MAEIYERYRQTSIQTAPPEQLVVMLYDGALRFLDQARVAMLAGADASIPIGRTQDILVELSSILNRDAGDVADNLARLYDFWIHRLFQAQIEADPARVDEVCTMLRELRDAWATVAAQRKMAVSQAPVASFNARG